MSPQFICQKNQRGEKISESTTDPSLNPLNGIDYIEVASVDQKTLDIHFIHPLPSQPGGVPAAPFLTKDNVIIIGGVRRTNIQVLSASASAEVLTITVNQAGDFSFYTLKIVNSATNESSPTGFDPILSQVDFSFKAGCPSDFDCKTVRVCPPEKRVEPDIDYLAKDYATFRRLMLDRLSTQVPDWQERNVADGQIALVELLAYVGDQLSYYQDAVATEAYLGTARKRISVRRHARLLDYFMHEGCNARVWLALDPAGNNIVVAKETQFATKGKVGSSSPDAAVVFETMHDITLQEAYKEISFYTWSDTECCLPKGATSATLKNDPALSLQIGDLLLFEEIRSPTTGSEADADHSHRHVVRLTAVDFTTDPLDGTPVANVTWDAIDALPFPLCISKTIIDETGVVKLAEISVARGNIVLADHGISKSWVDLPLISNGITHLPLPARETPLTHQGQARNEFGDLILDPDGKPMAFDPAAPAASAMQWEMRDALPQVYLTDGDLETWEAYKDLLNADEFTLGFVAEIDDEGRADLRFGKDGMGEQPDGLFTANYRIGNGRVGNVGAETITEIVNPAAGLAGVRNPLPAKGGSDPEPLEEVRQFAPQAFRVQERAVTEADWEEVAQRYPEVQRAAARFRWTGSWLTIFVTIDRKGGKPVDTAFKREIRTYLERYRLAGYDLEISAPVLVPLDISFVVCLKPGYFGSDVKQRLLDVFSDRDLTSGERGFFHPDNFTFGQPVFLSQLYARAMKEPSVASIQATIFQRWGKLPNQELELQELKPASLEIICLQNDPNFPENGRIQFEMEGGL